MAGLSRAGILVVLAACGGGQRAGQSDSAAMSTGAASVDTTAMAPSAAPQDSTMSAPAGATTADTAQAPNETAAPPAAAKTTAAVDSPIKAPAAQDTSKKAAAAQDTTKKAAAKPAGGGGGGTPQQVALGDSIFHGQAGGGTCSACHGQDAKGTAVAPDLTDSQWLNGDGSYQFIVTTVTNGVPKPKQHPAPMPPKGGAQLTDDQVKAVAAFVYSLSHKS